MSNTVLCACVGGPHDQQTFTTDYPGAYLQFFGEHLPGRYVLSGGNDDLRIYTWEPDE